MPLTEIVTLLLLLAGMQPSWRPAPDLQGALPDSVPGAGVWGAMVIQGLSRKVFLQPGDLNIGVLLPLSSYTRNSLCNTSETASRGVARLAESVAYGVREINQNYVLPNNLTFGFVVLDDCGKEAATAAQSLAFVPQTDCQANATASHPDDVITPYDVIGVIGSTRSSQTIAAATVLGPAHVPLVSFYSTSDELSNKDLYPYFLRAVPPDRFQFRAIVSFIQHYGWSYVSVLYDEGSYGENGFKQLRDVLSLNDVCMGSVQKLPLFFSQQQATETAEELLIYKRARVVIFITTAEKGRQVIEAFGRLRSSEDEFFIWIGSDAFSQNVESLADVGDLLWDAFVVSPAVSYVAGVEQGFMRLTPEKTTNPWFLDHWQSLFACSLQTGSCNTSLSIADSTSPSTPPSTTVAFVLDTLDMFANATLRLLLGDDCVLASAARLKVRDCVTGPRLLQELKATRQVGYTGWMEVDENGDRLGRYVIKQVKPGGGSGGAALVLEQVAEFDSLTRAMVVMKNISWSRTLTPGDKSSWQQKPPDSLCSDPCAPHQARVVQAVTCCWLCNPCRPNERLVLEGSRCSACPPFHWPDPSTANTTCVPVPPDHPRYDSLQGAVQASVAALCLAGGLTVLVHFHRHRRCRVIKACSRELSLLILLAVLLGYGVLLLLLAYPTDFTCRLSFLLFCTSFSLLYGPLLIRALRIFRIFDASRSSARRPRMIESSHQLLFAMGLVSVQVAMCTVVLVVHSDWTRLTQASDQERYVELSCEVPVAGLASFLAYTLLLEAACALLAFKTRHLPDNFNESKFIGLCVSATLVVLLCFIPAYVLASRQLLRVSMLALVLVLNHSVALVFLFLPKLYAVLYLQGAGEETRTVNPSTGYLATLTGRHRVGPTTLDKPQARPDLGWDKSSSPGTSHTGCVSDSNDEDVLPREGGKHRNGY